MNEPTIRRAKAQQNLQKWSQRVAECRSSGVSVSWWCTEHEINPKTYYNWQRKVFIAMMKQQGTLIVQPEEPARRFALFMKGQDVDLDEIYERFGVDYDLLSMMMRREADEEGKLHIRWGEQMIA